MTETTLIKALTEAGMGSRRKMTDAIKNGKVKVNGVIAENFRQPINAETDRILFDRRPVNLKAEQVVYLMLTNRTTYFVLPAMIGADTPFWIYFPDNTAICVSTR